MDSYSHRVSLRRRVVPSREKPVWHGHSCPRANPTRQLKVRKIPAGTGTWNPSFRKALEVAPPLLSRYAVEGRGLGVCQENANTSPSENDHVPQVLYTVHCRQYKTPL